MNILQLEIQLVAVVVAIACALPGTFLVLRKMAMMSDAISHSILFGIVVAFFYTHDLSSPLLVLAATATGLLTALFVELLYKSRRVGEDAAIGLVFPFLFSIGVILISRYAGNIHLDTDAVLLGEIAFTPFERLTIGGLDWGPKALYVMGGILLLNILFIGALYKELKLATFDPALAAALGFSPAWIHYLLMGLVSLTAVGAFDAVGSILVVALMIGPPAAAYLLTDRLSHMLLLSAGIGVLGSIGGYWLAHVLNASIAGSMATIIGIVFVLVYLLAPERGVLALYRRRQQQRLETAVTMLLVHIRSHQHRTEAEDECHIDHLYSHLKWDPQYTRRIIQHCQKEGWLYLKDDLLYLTEKGKAHIQQVAE
ncbi:MAG: metal ABC transporter permease [Calditrichaeota bacterium]|nr:metal ABC transporter permease [Calditrichota bacterium]